MLLKKVFDDSKLMQEIYNNKKLKRYTLFMIGVILQALAFNIFILPSDMVFGVSGVAVVINQLLGVEPAYVILIANLLLIVASLVYLGKDITKYTILGAILYPTLIELTEFLPQYIDLGNTEPVIVALTGAFIYGFGTGLIFKCGYTTGGTDVIKQIVSKSMKKSIGQATVYVEGIIVITGVFVFGWQSFIYSVISLVVISFITDKVILGISEYKTFQIVTEHYREVEKFITHQMQHGVTIINNRSIFTENKKKVLLCTIPTKEYYLLKEAILKIDSNAFFIITDTYEVQGGR